MGLFSLASPAFVFFGAATGVLAVPVLRRAPQPSLGRRKARVQPGACGLKRAGPKPSLRPLSAINIRTSAARERVRWQGIQS